MVVNEILCEYHCYEVQVVFLSVQLDHCSLCLHHLISTLCFLSDRMFNRHIVSIVLSLHFSLVSMVFEISRSLLYSSCTRGSALTCLLLIFPRM